MEDQPLQRKPGGYSWEFVVGVCRRVLQILPRIQTKNYNYPHPFSDQTSKIHTRFQTWPLGRNYFIITQIRAQTQKLFKPIWNSHISLSFLLIWNCNDKNVHTLRSSLENPTRFQTKMGKVQTRFQTKRCKNPTRWGGTYPYGLYKGVTPPPGRKT